METNCIPYHILRNYGFHLIILIAVTDTGMLVLDLSLVLITCSNTAAKVFCSYF